MENQHRKITGYRELDANEIALMNKIKDMGQRIAELHAEVAARPDMFDMRWASIAKTDFQTGLMALTRAVAQPTTF